MLMDRTHLGIFSVLQYLIILAAVLFCVLECSDVRFFSSFFPGDITQKGYEKKRAKLIGAYLPQPPGKNLHVVSGLSFLFGLASFLFHTLKLNVAHRLLGQLRQETWQIILSYCWGLTTNTNC